MKTQLFSKAAASILIFMLSGMPSLALAAGPILAQDYGDGGGDGGGNIDSSQTDSSGAPQYNPSTDTSIDMSGGSNPSPQYDPSTDTSIDMSGGSNPSPQYDPSTDPSIDMTAPYQDTQAPDPDVALYTPQYDNTPNYTLQDNTPADNSYAGNDSNSQSTTEGGNGYVADSGYNNGNAGGDYGLANPSSEGEPRIVDPEGVIADNNNAGGDVGSGLPNPSQTGGLTTVNPGSDKGDTGTNNSVGVTQVEIGGDGHFDSNQIRDLGDDKLYFKDNSNGGSLYSQGALIRVAPDATAPEGYTQVYYNEQNNTISPDAHNAVVSQTPTTPGATSDGNGGKFVANTQTDSSGNAQPSDTSGDGQINRADPLAVAVNTATKAGSNVSEGLGAIFGGAGTGSDAGLNGNTGKTATASGIDSGTELYPNGTNGLDSKTAGGGKAAAAAPSGGVSTASGPTYYVNLTQDGTGMKTVNPGQPLPVGYTQVYALGDGGFSPVPGAGPVQAIAVAQTQGSNGGGSGGVSGASSGSGAAPRGGATGSGANSAANTPTPNPNTNGDSNLGGGGNESSFGGGTATGGMYRNTDANGNEVGIPPSEMVTQPLPWPAKVADATKTAVTTTQNIMKCAFGECANGITSTAYGPQGNYSQPENGTSQAAPRTTAGNYAQPEDGTSQAQQKAQNSNQPEDGTQKPNEGGTATSNVAPTNNQQVYWDASSQSYRPLPTPDSTGPAGGTGASSANGFNATPESGTAHPDQSSGPSSIFRQTLEQLKLDLGNQFRS